MKFIQKLAAESSVAAAAAAFSDNLPQILELTLAIQQIPAPTFAEAARAAAVEQYFRELDGLTDITQDPLHNVYARLPGQQPGAPVVVSAHTDTVFPLETDLRSETVNGRLYGPGIADNSAGVAGLLTLARSLLTHDIQPQRDIWFVANIAEEGLGDLKGMRAVVERFGEVAAYIIIEGGSLGHVIHQGIGVARYQIETTAVGGHSWADFGVTSAIHTLGHIISAIDSLTLPTKPKTTYNVGVIEGGTSINTIAPSASAQLDLRSEDSEILKQVCRQVEEIVARYNAMPGLSVTMTQIGNRPAGQLPRTAKLVQWAMAALRHVGLKKVELGASSTDANIPLSAGYQAVCIGLTQSGNIHRTDEYLQTHYIPQGLTQLLLLTLAAANGQPKK